MMIVQGASLALAAPLGLLAWLCSAVWFRRSPQWGIFLYLVAVVLENTPFAWGLHAVVGRFAVTPSAIVLIPMLTAVVLAGLFPGEREASPVGTRSPVLVTGLKIWTGLVLLGAISGAMASTPTYGVGTWMGLVSGAALAWYAVTFGRRMTPSAGTAIAAAGGVACLVALATVGKYGFRSADEGIVVGEDFVTTRPLVASAALLVLLGLLQVLPARQMKAWVRTSLIAVFLATIAVSQVRSVWLAAVVAVPLSIGLDLRRRGAGVRIALAMPFAGLALLLGMQFFAIVPEQLRTSAESTGSFEWRLEKWRSYGDLERSLGQWIAGALSGDTTVVDGVTFAYLAHNMAIEVINLLGVVGLACWAVIVVSAIVQARRALRPGQYPQLASQLVALSVYSLTYGWPAYSWLFVGLAATVAGPRASAPAVQMRPEPQSVRGAAP